MGTHRPLHRGRAAPSPTAGTSAHCGEKPSSVPHCTTRAGGGMWLCSCKSTCAPGTFSRAARCGFFPAALVGLKPPLSAALLVLRPQGHSSRIVQQPQGGRSPGPGSALSSQSGRTRSCWRGWVVLARCLLTMQKLSIFFLFCSDLFLGTGIRAGPGWSFVPAQAVLQCVG